MYKKIAISFLAIILIFNFTMKDYTDAAVASKAATLTAKKILKEVVQEASIETAVNLALMEAMQIAGDYEAKAGYKIVCPSGGTTCDKPVQIKETLSENDKTAIKAQSEIELDKLISPDGKGFSKFQSFMDWFLPIWLVTFAMTALTYAIDSDFRTMINEAGYNALVALGIITPLGENAPATPITEIDAPVKTETGTSPDANANTMSLRVHGTSAYNNQTGYNFTYKNMLVNSEYSTDDPIDNGIFSQYSFDVMGSSVILLTKNSFRTSSTRTGNGIEMTVALNGQSLVTTLVSTTSGYNNYGFGTYQAQIASILEKKTKSVMTRLPYEVDGFMYTDVLVRTVDGNTLTFQQKSNKFTYADPQTSASTRLNIIQSKTHTLKTTIYDEITPSRNIYPPNYEEIAPDINTVAKTPYESEDGQKIALVPPTAFPYKEETTGETVYRVPNATGDGSVFQKEDGTPVPEDNVIPGDTPTITKNPEGVPQYTPAPTPSAPTPAPAPLTPGEVTQPTPDGNTPPPTPPAEEPPLSEYPEGEKCDAKLQFPILSPLKEQFSTSFPFSIPWDIGRAIDAAFGDIGTEKPEFEYTFKIHESEFPIKITTPKLFDDWKPFTDSLLLFVFDVSIMFGIYRFVKGGGS